MHRVFIIVGILLICTSCAPYYSIKRKRASREFIEKYGDEDFSFLSNTCIAIRGWSWTEPEAILAIGVDSIKEPYLVHVNVKTFKTYFNYVVYPNPKMDTALMNKKGIAFLKYKVNKLKVDKFGNVYVGIYSNERVELIRAANFDSIPNYYKDFIHVKDNWYRTD